MMLNTFESNAQVISALENWMEEEDDDSRILALIDEEITEYEQITCLVCQYFVSTFMCKEPRRTSKRSGHVFVQEILADHETQCHQMFRLEKHVFYRLCSKLVEHGLRDSRNVGVEEMVGMFLLTIGHGVGNRIVQRLFHHSGETVSRLLHMVLEACFSLARENIKPSDPEFIGCHRKIREDPRYYPYFKDAIGAIDGTHIKAVITGPNRERYIGRKGYTTQNVMAVCDWDMCFTFVLAGWEGSAHDARMFQAAVSNPAQNFPHPPPGKYYLVDAGYPTPVGYLGPYRCQRYHLPEFQRRPGFANAQETFNYYHSSLRSTIERTFGVWKNRFELLQKMRKYSYQTQVRLVVATMAIHNFIRRNSQSDVNFSTAETGDIAQEDDNTVDDAASSSNVAAASSTRMNHIRDRIRDQLVRNL